MDNVVKGALIVGSAIVFGAYLIAMAVEGARKAIVVALREKSGPDRSPDQLSAIPRAIDMLGHDLAAIRRKIRDEPEPQTLEQMVASWGESAQPADKPNPLDEKPLEDEGSSELRD